MIVRSLLVDHVFLYFFGLFVSIMNDDEKIHNPPKSAKCTKHYKYNDEQKITELGRSSISDDFSNFSFSSAFPITLAA